jgi:hypothetical protein
MRYSVILNQKWISILQLVPGLFRVPRSPGGIQLPEKYKENFDVSSEGPSSGIDVDLSRG